MDKASLFLNLVIIFSTQINAMQLEMSPFPQEISKKILFFVPLMPENINDASRIMDNCTQVCWSWNKFMNDKHRTLTWIKDLANKHDLSDMDVTQQLRTEGAFNRYTLQQSSLNGWTSVNYDARTKNLNLLSRGGLDLNFTYGEGKLTTLMSLAGCEVYGYPQTAQCFIALGADINMKRGCDGCDALMIALLTLNRSLIKMLINHPNLQPNAQDKKGYTPLLCLLDVHHRWNQGRPVNPIKVVRQLLEKGADPELGNNDGLTPLKQAEKINNPQLIELFKNAIVKKHSTQYS